MITLSEARGVRSLHFGSPWIQGAMRIARPYALEVEYTRELMLPLLLRDDAEWPRKVLQVGLGAASVTKFLWKQRPECRQVVVEISPEVLAVARAHFRLPEDERVRIEIADGADWMATARGRYDLIVVDGFDELGRAGMLDSVPFYCNAAGRLAANGMLAVNFLTRRKSAAPSVNRMKEAFEGRVLELPPSEAGNVVAIAATGRAVPLDIVELRAAGARLKAATGLDLAPTLSRIEPFCASAGPL